MFGEGLTFLAVTPFNPKTIIFRVVRVRCLKGLAMPSQTTVDLSV